jgi:hypothetical protein
MVMMDIMTLLMVIIGVFWGKTKWGKGKAE